MADNIFDVNINNINLTKDNLKTGIFKINSTISFKKINFKMH
jgi:hypothetical protein